MYYKNLALLSLTVDFRSRHSLSAGGPGSLLGPVHPAGVSCLPLQSTGF